MARRVVNGAGCNAQAAEAQPRITAMAGINLFILFIAYSLEAALT